MSLESLPLTPNGKVDRKALPDPDPALASETGRPVRRPQYSDRARDRRDLGRGAGPGSGRDSRHLLRSWRPLAAGGAAAGRVPRAVRPGPGIERPVPGPDRRRAWPRLIDESRGTEAGPIEEALEPEASRREGPVPASSPQRRIWFLQQMEPESPAYNITAAVRLRGEVDLPAMVRALNEVVRRHEALRTTFAVADGQPVQVIAERLTLDLPLTDLSSLPKSRRETEVAARLREEAARPFDLARGPLIRAELLRLGHAEHVAVLNLHHIIADGLSIGVLIQELSTLYAAFQPGSAVAAAGVADPVCRLQPLATGMAPRRGAPRPARLLASQARRRAVLELPTDRPRPAFPSRRAGSRWLTLPSPLVREAPRAGAGRGGLPVHDPAGGLPGPASTLLRAGRRRRRRRRSPAGPGRSSRP